MHQLKNFSTTEFLDQYWQKQLFVITDSIDVNDLLITGEDLAGLACEQGIESRMVFSDNTQSHWNCEYGPFDNHKFSQLEKINWTLLVQSVDDFFPEIRKLRELFEFIPKWRLDDVMLSYATPGGGVGPHFDYYDVFLIQLSGSREWKIGQSCNSSTPLREHEDLKLLEEFILRETHVMEPGTILYIPAGLAHWGTALSEDCITASVGFRAPSYSDLLQGGLVSLANEFTADQRYKDSYINSAPDKYLIDESVTKEMEKLLEKLDKKSIINALSDEFSRQVTEVRDQDVFEYCYHTIDEIDMTSLVQHPASRFAYRKTPATAILYVNGVAYSTSEKTAIAICHSAFLDIQKRDHELILELVNNGSLLLDLV